MFPHAKTLGTRYALPSAFCSVLRENGRWELISLRSGGEIGRFTEIEACLVLLIAYTSYFFSNALTMSGKSLSLSPLAIRRKRGKADEIEGESRNRFVVVLWDHFETLRLSQHVTSNSTYNSLHVWYTSSSKLNFPEHESQITREGVWILILISSSV